MRNFKRWFRRRGGGRRAANKDRLTNWLYDSGGGHKKTPSRLPQRYVIFAVLILLVVFLAHSFYRFDRRIVPLVLEAAELRIQTEINNVINSVVQDIISENQITASDFILQNTMDPHAKPVLSVNTVLVNEICNAAAKAISARLNNLEPEIVSVPIGMIFNLDTLAQVGPHFTFTMAPIGNALVDYETSFTAVGINQTHFAVLI